MGEQVGILVVMLFFLLLLLLDDFFCNSFLLRGIDCEGLIFLGMALVLLFSLVVIMAETARVFNCGFLLLFGTMDPKLPTDDGRLFIRLIAGLSDSVFKNPKNVWFASLSAISSSYAK